MGFRHGIRISSGLGAIYLAAASLALLAVGCWTQVETTAPAPSPSAQIPAVSPTAGPAVTALPEATSEETWEAMEMGTFTILYDNNAYDPALRTDWGFACLVETGAATVLFDTGGNGTILLGNMAELGFDPRAIDVVVLSHAHADHTGGLAALLDTGVTPTVYVPAAFPAAFKADVRARTDLVEVTGPVEILPGIHTTGQVGSGIVEQALVVETGDGLVVVTGCAHPGIVEMVRQAKEAVTGEVGRSGATPVLVLGGFHLKDTGQPQIEAIIAELRDLGVQRVAPCHCTGDLARRMFADAFDADCALAGVGQAFVVGGAG